MQLILILIALLTVIEDLHLKNKCHTHGLPLPFDEYAYVQARNELLREDSLNFTVLSDRERIVSIYFEKLKVDEFKRTGMSSFIPARPIETELESMQASHLYAQLKSLPKGGNIHIHENQMLDRRIFLEMIRNSTEYDMLHICDKKHKAHCKTNRCTCTEYYLTYFGKVKFHNRISDISNIKS